MHAAMILKRKERAEERKRKAFSSRYPAVMEQLQETGYRQALPSSSQLIRVMEQKIKPEIDVEKERSRILASKDPQHRMISCALLHSADPSYAISVFDKGLKGKNPATRKACAQALADMFLCADDFSERWIALFTLAKANDRYVVEATEELRELFGIDPSNALRGNAFWKMKEVLGRPHVGASVGGAIIALLKTGYIRAGLSLFAAGMIAGTVQKGIERLSRRKIDTEHILSLACEVMNEEPEAI